MSELRALAEKYESDKATHEYCEVYEAYWGKMRESIESVLEIGVFNGASHKMWLDFFPNAKVYGLDNGQYGDRTQWPEDERFKAMCGDQAKLSSLWQAGEELGPFDIILDDGGHTMWQQQLSFAGLWPYVKPGGFYVIEDLHSSLREEFFLTSPVRNLRLPTGASDAAETTLEMLGMLIHVGLEATIHRVNDGKSITGVIRKGKEAK